MTVSKNYLAAAEIKELNRLTTIVLDIFEDQLDVGRLKTMAEAADLLDSQLTGLGRALLSSGGAVSKTDADAHAEREYDRYKLKQKALRHEEADRAISELKATQKSLNRG